MQHFRIFPEGYNEPKPEAKYTYPIGSFVVFVKDITEAFSVQVRTA